MEKLSVSVVTYKTDPLVLNKLLKCLLDSSLRPKIFVVDNSPDNTLKECCRGGEFHYIFNNRNIGYGAGHNIAIRQVCKQSKYHLVVNPDITFKKGTLESIYNYMEDNADVGLVIPRVFSLDGSIDYSSKLLPEPHNLFYRRFKFTGGPFKSSLEKINSLYELRLSGYDAIMEVPFASGCFMFIRGEAFDKAGIFDERFFMYLEDCDLTRRIHKHFKTMHFPMACVCHTNTRGSYKDFTVLRYHMVSAIKYFNKWGWFFDKERDAINDKVLKSLGR